MPPFRPVSKDLNFKLFPVSSLENFRLLGLVSLYHFDYLVLRRHPPALPNPAQDFPSRSTDSVTPSWRVSSSLDPLVLVSPTEPSLEVASWPLWHGAVLFRSDQKEKFLTWLQENIEKLLLLNKRRWFHSSRIKLPLVNMSASWFLVSTYFSCISGSKLILSNNQSSANLWVLDTRLFVGLRPLIIILMTASVSSK